MKESVSHYICKLLFIHDCVILPDFGGFIGNRKSAQLNRATKTLFPPTKQILFNKNIKTNDGLLIAYISEEENISIKKAQKFVAQYTDEITEELKTKKVLRIEKIGLFTLAKDNNILFVQDNEINYNIESFGMEGVAAISNNKIHIKERRKTVQLPHVKTLLKAAAIILPLITISYLSISEEEKINSVYKQMASLVPVSGMLTTNTTIKDIESPKIIIPKIKKEVSKIEKIKYEIPVNINTPENRYYIIGGAFSNKGNAKKMMTQLRNQGYNAEMLKSNSLTRVSYDSFSNKEDALLALSNIKENSPDAWLLTK